MLALRVDYEDRALWRHVLFSLHSSYSAETLLLGVLHCFYWKRIAGNRTRFYVSLSSCKHYFQPLWTSFIMRLI